MPSISETLGLLGDNRVVLATGSKRTYDAYVDKYGLMSAINPELFKPEIMSDVAMDVAWFKAMVLLTCLGWEDNFYAIGVDLVTRIIKTEGFDETVLHQLGRDEKFTEEMIGSDEEIKDMLARDTHNLLGSPMIVDWQLGTGVGARDTWQNEARGCWVRARAYYPNGIPEQVIRDEIERDPNRCLSNASRIGLSELAPKFADDKVEICGMDHEGRPREPVIRDLGILTGLVEYRIMPEGILEELFKPLTVSERQMMNSGLLRYNCWMIDPTSMLK